MRRYLLRLLEVWAFALEGSFDGRCFPFFRTGNPHMGGLIIIVLVLVIIINGATGALYDWSSSCPSRSSEVQAVYKRSMKPRLGDSLTSFWTANRKLFNLRPASKMANWGRRWLSRTGSESNGLWCITHVSVSRRIIISSFQPFRSTNL